MSANVEVGWCTSVDSDWELFGGEIKLDCVNCDDVGVYADCLDSVARQDTMDDDVASVCSSATSWSCLPGNNIVELCSELYLCKPEDEDKFDALLPNELIDDIASCIDSGLVSLEQFYKINHLIDGDSNSPDFLLSADVTDKKVIVTDSCGSEESDCCSSDEVVSDVIEDMDTSRFAAYETPCPPVASLECEELYEESVSINDVPNTISCEEFRDLIAGNCDRSVIKLEFSPDTKVSRMCQRPSYELTHSRRLRKKEQNKSAALRYRLKKRSEQDLVMSEYAVLEHRNVELRTRLDAMEKEILYLKSLIEELCP